MSKDLPGRFSSYFERFSPSLPHLNGLQHLKRRFNDILFEIRFSLFRLPLFVWEDALFSIFLGLDGQI